MTSISDCISLPENLRKLPVEVKVTFLPANGNGGSTKGKSKLSVNSVMFDTDELPRADTRWKFSLNSNQRFTSKCQTRLANSPIVMERLL